MYAGMAGGALAPVVALRYSGWGMELQDWRGEVLAWGVAGALALPLTLHSAMGGLVVGYLEARRLKMERLREGGELEEALGSAA